MTAVLFVSALLTGCAVVPVGQYSAGKTTTTTTITTPATVTSPATQTTTTVVREQSAPPAVYTAPIVTGCWDPWWNVMRPCAPYGAVIVPRSSIYLRFGGGGRHWNRWPHYKDPSFDDFMDSVLP